MTVLPELQQQLKREKKGSQEELVTFQKQNELLFEEYVLVHICKYEEQNNLNLYNRSFGINPVLLQKKPTGKLRTHKYYR